MNWIKISDATASGKYIYGTKEKIRPAGVSRSRLVKPGDFLLSNSMSFGRPYIMRTTGCVHDGWLVLSDKSGEFDQDFLYHFLSSPDAYKQFDQLAAGSTVRNLNIDSARKVRVPIPALVEQRAIVAILDEAFAGISAAVANAEKNLANVGELFEAYLQAIFERRTVGWAEKPLSAVCKRITVGHVGSMANRYQIEGIPFLRSQNIRPFNVSLENVVYIDEQFDNELKKSQLKPGDLAIVRTGYPGTAAVIPPWLTKANCSDLVIFRPSDEVNPYYLEAFFNSSFGKRLVLGKLVGAAQKHFNVSAAKEAILHYPSAPEQNSIVAKIKQLREETGQLETVYQNKIATLLELKQAILNKAFSGELTARSLGAMREAAE